MGTREQTGKARSQSSKTAAYSNQIYADWIWLLHPRVSFFANASQTRNARRVGRERRSIFRKTRWNIREMQMGITPFRMLRVRIFGRISMCLMVASRSKCFTCFRWRKFVEEYNYRAVPAVANLGMFWFDLGRNWVVSSTKWINFFRLVN